MSFDHRNAVKCTHDNACCCSVSDTTRPAYTPQSAPRPQDITGYYPREATWLQCKPILFRASKWRLRFKNSLLRSRLCNSWTPTWTRMALHFARAASGLPCAAKTRHGSWGEPVLGAWRDLQSGSREPFHFH